ncbi:MAG: indolepyruvate ferredoxin oxidoreductase family protein [Burkholderiaceae bacterium]
MNAPLDPRVRAHLERALKEVTLDDKYTLEAGRAFMSGTQALVRLPMLQRERDRRAGLNTKGFISGYRGSPLGGFDQALWKAHSHLNKSGIVFQPGLNEDLAATAIWGTQQVGLTPRPNVDGVFSIWYGKGPGVDRSGDVFKHANAAGTARHGGVIALAGDDHGAKSSTLPHQSDHIFKACGLPVFYPASIQDYLDLGLHAWAMSRWSGLWAGMKAVTETVEASATVDVDPERVKILLPEDFAMPAGDPHGLNIRWPDAPMAQERRLFDYKWYAALAYVRLNRLNRSVIDPADAWFGIVTAGKAYVDTIQALDELGLDRATCEQLGIRLFKCDVVWPLEASSLQAFAAGLDEILVVEEKRQILEYQVKEELYSLPEDKRPRVYGKFDEKDGRGGEWAMPQGQWLLPAYGELSPAMIARAIASRLLNPGQYAARLGGGLPADIRRRIEDRLEILSVREHLLAAPHIEVARTPTFCSGCPHNTSTHVPEGSRAVAGIGCHFMALWKPERQTSFFTQMGGEGTPWIGQAPFVDETHIFANLGDGTYFHSGLLAIRASVAAGVNITYKVLYNDAVAMTGGQPHDGPLTVPAIVAQVRAEGATQVVVVTDEPEKYDDVKGRAPFDGVEIHHRDLLDWVQRQIREVKGTSVLVYDQTCASEKRRRRKRVVDGRPGFPDPARRVVINELVCEGCGDCNVQSACVSVEPVETEFGRKRRINQSSCNKDYSCLKGFCPSFITVEGGQLRKGTAVAQHSLDALPSALLKPEDPAPVVLGDEPNGTFGILVTGIGGTGVVTIGQLLGMASHLEGRGVSVLDMAGLAQKGGAVFSHVQIAADPQDLHSTRIVTGEADLVIGCDLVVTAGSEALSKMRPRVTRAVVNGNVAPTADFLADPDWDLPAESLKRNILDAAGEVDIDFIDANDLAVGLLGDAIYTNPLVLGYAFQKGWLPLTRESLERAIELNGVQVERNKLAFLWGRRAALDPALVTKLARPAEVRPDGAQVIELKRPVGQVRNAQDLDALIERRADFLVGYQSKRLARKYRRLVEKVRMAEQARFGSGPKAKLTEAVARYYFKLLAYKDEYEVARLHSDPAFRASIAAQFEGDFHLNFYLAPPLATRIDPRIGRPVKKRYGPGMMTAFGWLARMKILRGTPFDPFGYTRERSTERGLIRQYERTVDQLLDKLDAGNLELAVEIASVPDKIRGYGHVKERHLEQARAHEEGLLRRWRGDQVPGGDETRVIELKRA